MIHVCFALCDKTGHYSKFTGTAMCSLFENTLTPSQLITVHILHDNTLTNDNLDKFCYLAGRYNQIVKFYNVDKLCRDKLTEYVNLFPAIKDSRVSVAAIYRILIPQLFSEDVDKVIYLDSDVIINLDIKELWDVELDDKILAATPEVEIVKSFSDLLSKYIINAGLVAMEDYFNSGVLVINLKRLRQSEELIINGLKWRNEHVQCECFDQDVLNYLFSKDYVHLPEKFGLFISKARVLNNVHYAIYHYIRNTLSLNLNDSFNRLWFNYFTKTPWFNISVISNFCKNVNNFREQRRNILINLSVAISGKTRAFVVDENEDVNWLEKTYSIRDEEDIVIVDKDEEDSLHKLIEFMNADRAKKIFFIKVSNTFIDSLKAAGFVEGKDFFNHYDLFSPGLFSKVDISSLIQLI